jgi:hypothetical protein
MIINDNLSFVIPVYLKTISDKIVLSKTMEKILTIASDIIVISQGIKPHFNNKKIKHYHSSSSLGKWNAVSYAKNFKVNDFIFIHDGDNPFKEESYKNILKFQKNTFIQRDQIILYAHDELSRESRKYMELFLNKYSAETQGKCIDIQSGGVILERDIFQELNFSSFGDYGGELAIYNHLEAHNIPIDFIDMEVEVGKSRQQSNYAIGDILQSVIHTPLSMVRVLVLLKICMDDYDRYIASNQKFKNEVLYFLRKYNLVY